MTGSAALAAAMTTAALFFAAASLLGRAPAAAIWGGTVWVFLLATIIALPLVATARRRDAGDGARRQPWSSDRSAMALALAVWACTLPVVFLLVAPFLGLRAALLTALVLLGVMAIVCWAVCSSSPSWERPRD